MWRLPRAIRNLEISCQDLTSTKYVSTKSSSLVNATTGKCAMRNIACSVLAHVKKTKQNASSANRPQDGLGSSLAHAPKPTLLPKSGCRVLLSHPVRTHTLTLWSTDGCQWEKKMLIMLNRKALRLFLGLCRKPAARSDYGSIQTRKFWSVVRSLAAIFKRAQDRRVGGHECGQRPASAWPWRVWEEPQ